MKPGCNAYVIGDQYHCDSCGLSWDINDPEPPECKRITATEVIERDPIKIMAEMMDDLTFYGTFFIRNGERIPPKDIIGFDLASGPDETVWATKVDGEFVKISPEDAIKQMKEKLNND